MSISLIIVIVLVFFIIVGSLKNLVDSFTSPNKPKPKKEPKTMYCMDCGAEFNWEDTETIRRYDDICPECDSEDIEYK